MPSLEEVLKKTKIKSEQISIVRRPVTIAEQDRPYSRNESITDPLPLSTVEAPLTDEALSSPGSTMLAEAKPKKPNTNYIQSTHKVDAKPNTNYTQSRHKVDTKFENQTQTTHKLHTKLNTTKAQSRHKPHTNHTQTTHKVDTNLTQNNHISTLIGLQRSILLFFFEECKKSHSLITEPLSIPYISSSLEITLGSIKTSILRLCAKDFLRVNHFKNGRGGWSQYEIPSEVYKELLQMETQHKLNTKYTQTSHELHTNISRTTHKLDTQLNTELNTSPSSSSSLNIKTTTTREEDICDEWNFDITPYARFGFTKTQIKQLAPLNVIPAAQVEQSLIEFAYDLDNNALPFIKTSKINFLMGLLRSGNSYVSEGFKSEQEAIILEMAKRSKAKQETLLNAKFEAWLDALDNDQRRKVEEKMPTHLMVLYRTHGITNPDLRSWLFDCFLQSSS